jgi:hypothetical protein
MPSFREADLLGIAWGGHQFPPYFGGRPPLEYFVIAVWKAKEAESAA